MTKLFKHSIDSLETFKHQQNSVVFSSLKEFHQPVFSKGFAIKYVVDGIERYTLNSQKFSIEKGKYLLSNQTSDGDVEIESKKTVKGICINISPEIITEIAGSYQRPDTAFSDSELGKFFTTNLFFENQYDAQHTHVGKLLIDLEKEVESNFVDKNDFSQEFFYNFSEKIMLDQIPIFKQLHAIPSIKLATKKDLLKRLFHAKEYMDSSFLQSPTIETIAREACMSEYHFFRLFKHVFGQSPNQYLIQKKLEKSLKILQYDHQMVSFAAIECGFTDIHSFSKAFKKYFGFAPSKHKEN